MFVATLPYPVRMCPEGMAVITEGIDVVGPPHGPDTQVTHLKLVRTESPGRGTVGRVESSKNAEVDTVGTVFGIL